MALSSGALGPVWHNGKSSLVILYQSIILNHIKLDTMWFVMFKLWKRIFLKVAFWLQVRTWTKKCTCKTNFFFSMVAVLLSFDSGNSRDADQSENKPLHQSLIRVTPLPHLLLWRQSELVSFSDFVTGSSTGLIEWAWFAVHSLDCKAGLGAN